MGTNVRCNNDQFTQVGMHYAVCIREYIN
jgi:hypothetical protein